ncbi:MAG TPA: ABC transporter permease [Bryobacteraceae bacterium]|nr:ABC transporter permease [Bryobacteraceae bacterium]
MTALVWDLRYALRTLRKTPLFTSVAVLSLALGIGANTAIFTLVHQLILQSLPVPHPEQLVLLSAVGRHYGSNSGPNALSYPMYRDFRDKNQVFSGMFCRTDETLAVTFEGKTELVAGETVSGNYFPVLGVGAAIGRVFAASDDLYQGAHPLAVLSYGYWKTRFAGDRGVVGKKIVANGYPLTIIGVSQAGFDGTEVGISPQIRIPMTMHDDLPRGDYSELNDRRRRFLQVFGRLKPGESIEQAKAGLQPLFHQILEMEVRQKEFAKAPDFMKQAFLRMSIDVLPGSKGRSQLRRQFSKPLWALTAIVGLVLLIACSNLANLLIARASSRQKEIAVRLAMGASRGQLVRQLIVESLLLSVAGGVAGVGLAALVDQALIAFLPARMLTLTLSSKPDVAVLGFTIGVSLLTGLLLGLVPALQATRPQLATTLKDQAAAVVHGPSVALRKSLVVLQVTFSLVLLIGAGLFLQSLRKLHDLDPGFDTANLLRFEVEPTLSRFDRAWARDYYRRLKERLDSLPGVSSAALAVIPVLEDSEWDNWVTIEGYTPKPGETPDPHVQFCSEGYFETLKIPILLGRPFLPKDNDNAPKVVIVNQKFARRYFGDRNPIGHHMGMGIDPGTKTDMEIVGVAGDAKYENLREPVPEEMYIPFRQRKYVNDMTAYVRTRSDPVNLFRTMRQVVREVDASVPIYDLNTVGDKVEVSLLTERLLATLSSAFGLLATLLAALGLYGVMAYMVARRTREIGIRMALGAGGGSVVWLVMREVLLLAAIGLGIGLPAAWLLARLVETQLFGIRATDPLTMLLAAAGIGAMAALAGYLPARRATTIDPIRALRWE